MLATPLALGSWVGLIPSVLVATGYILRIVLEERVLLEELEGFMSKKAVEAGEKAVISKK